jgi:hypothetical protein
LLAEAVRPVGTVTGSLVVTPEVILGALDVMGDAQPINRKTRAVHAAFATRLGSGGGARGRRHNALDKLPALPQGRDASDGFFWSPAFYRSNWCKAAAIVAPAGRISPTALRAHGGGSRNDAGRGRAPRRLRVTHPQRIRTVAPVKVGTDGQR